MKELGIYVHIPFCAKKCDYCDFVSFANSDKIKHEKYVQSVIKEIQNFKLKDEDYIISTIYIGGGTPSYIDEKHISKIVQAIFRKFKVAQSPEITLEVNPGTSTLEKLKEYKDTANQDINIKIVIDQRYDGDLIKFFDEEFSKQYGTGCIFFDNLQIIQYLFETVGTYIDLVFGESLAGFFDQIDICLLCHIKCNFTASCI